MFALRAASLAGIALLWKAVARVQVADQEGQKQRGLTASDSLKSHPLTSEVELSLLSGSSTADSDSTATPSPDEQHSLQSLPQPELALPDSPSTWEERPQRPRQQRTTAYQHEQELVSLEPAGFSAPGRRQPANPSGMPTPPQRPQQAAAALPRHRQAAQTLESPCAAGPVAVQTIPAQNAGQLPGLDSSTGSKSPSLGSLSPQQAVEGSFPGIRKVVPHGSPQQQSQLSGVDRDTPMQMGATPPTSSALAPHKRSADYSARLSNSSLLATHPGDATASDETDGSDSAESQSRVRPQRQLSRLNTTRSKSSAERQPPANGGVVTPSSAVAASVLQSFFAAQARSPSAASDASAAVRRGETPTQSVLAQLLQPDTPGHSTGTPMARDLTEALAALASDKRLMSTFQETRSFSSPDLLLLAQQLQQQQHGSPAASQDAGEAGSADTAALPAASSQAQNDPGPPGTAAIPWVEDGQATIGSRFLKAVQDAAEGTGEIDTSPLKQHQQKPPRSPESLKRSRESLEIPLALKLDVLAGPAQDSSFTTPRGAVQVTLGRLDNNSLTIQDSEVSGHHAVMRWDSAEKCWQVTDVGSLNGTTLNGRTISTNNRRRGREHRLSSDDLLQLGSYTKIRVTNMPADIADGDMPLLPKRVHTPPSAPDSFVAEERQDNPQTPVTPSPEGGRLLQSDVLRLEGCVMTRTGREHQRRSQTCEDVPHAEIPLRGTQGVGLFCIFDGHCGRTTAKEARALLPEILASRIGQASAAMQAGRGADAIWEEVFLATDRALRSDEGCTATALLVWQDASGSICLQAANVGDSAAFVSELRPGAEVQPLTADHRLTNPLERERLAAMGIHLGSDRTRLYGLNLARCLGDRFLKDEDLGLSAQPHISPVVRLGRCDSALVLMASDGLWDVVDAEGALGCALQTHADGGGSSQAMTAAVVQQAQRNRTRDDLTVVVLKIKPAA